MQIFRKEKGIPEQTEEEKKEIKNLPVVAETETVEEVVEVKEEVVMEASMEEAQEEQDEQEEQQQPQEPVGRFSNGSIKE